MRDLSENKNWIIPYLVEVLSHSSQSPNEMMVEMIEGHLRSGADVNADQHTLIKYASFTENFPLFYLTVKYGGDYRCLQARGYLFKLGIEVDQLESRDQLIEYLDVMSVHYE